MKADGQSKTVYIIYDQYELEFVYQYRTYQYNARKGIFKTYSLCEDVCKKLNKETGKDSYKVYELSR